MSFLLEHDAVNGKEGTAFMTKDGRNIELFQLKKLQADAEFQEADFKVVGTRLVQKKTTGVALTGSMDIYYGTPEFLAMLIDYQKTGKLPVMSIQVINNDPATTVGRQVVALYGVKLGKIPVALLDADADFLSGNITFSYTSVEVLNAFNAPER
jgi:hypothetical protein